MKASLTILLLLSACVLSPVLATGQITVLNIDDAPSTTGGQNCTNNKVVCSDFCWEWEHDSGTPGTACANSSLVGNPQLDGQARKYDVSWTAGGGARFHAFLGAANLDTADKAFSYDAWVQYTDLSHINRLEFDLNQVITDKDTIIFGTQCDFSGGFWQYTDNALSPSAHWLNTGIPCRKSDWTLNTWHHVVIYYRRATCVTVGTCLVSYDGVSFDGVPKQFNVGPVNSAFTLGWCQHPLQLGCLVVNFQLDGDIESPLTLTSVNSNAVYQGTITGGANNALVGRIFSIFGFANGGNNLVAATVTASTATSLTFSASTTMETCPGSCASDPAMTAYADLFTINNNQFPWSF